MDLKEQQKDYESLTIANDFIFGKVMQNPELCEGLLQRIFPNVQILNLEYPISQKTIRETPDAKSVRLDILVTAQSGREVYDIEMQATDTHEIPKRMRYYHGQLDQDFFAKGKPYSALPKTFVIFICPFDLFGRGRHLYTFRSMCVEDGTLELNDGATGIFLNAKGILDDAPELRPFLDYVNGKVSDDPYVQRVHDAVVSARHNSEWRLEYMRWEMEMRERDARSRAEGEAKKADEMIRNMLTEKFPLDVIARISGMSLEYIQALV